MANVRSRAPVLEFLMIVLLCEYAIVGCELDSVQWLCRERAPAKPNTFISINKENYIWNIDLAVSKPSGALCVAVFVCSIV